MSHKARAMLIGAVAGAFLGVAFAWVASDGVKEEDGDAKTALQALGPMDYFSLGIAILTLARQFGGMLKKA